MIKVLFADLEKKEYELKTLTELRPYIGGLGVGLRLLQEYRDKDPLIFSIGPLNGFFPFASKTSIIFENGGLVEDLYIGGTLSTRMKFAGIDSIVITGRSEEPVILDLINESLTFRSADTDPDSHGLPGKKSVIRPVMDKYLLDRYFATPDSMFEEKLSRKKVRGLVVTGTKNFGFSDREKYEDIYHRILSRTNEITVPKADNPSCSGCPVGCDKSKFGEIGGNVLVHSLVACAFSEPIYSNVGVVFSCLNILGYDYTHEDIEALPTLIKDILADLS